MFLGFVRHGGGVDANKRRCQSDARMVRQRMHDAGTRFIHLNLRGCFGRCKEKEGLGGDDSRLA